MNVQLSATVLGLFVTAGDMFLCLRDEKELIWNLPTLFQTPEQSLYFLSRYLAILAQICDVVTATFWKCKYVAIPAHHCYIHLVYKSVVCWTFVILLQMVLMLRVYALYSRIKPMAYFLGLILLARVALGSWVIGRYRNFAAGSMGFNFICLTEARAHSEPGLAAFLFGEIAFQAIMLVLTMFKTYPWSLKGVFSLAPDLASVLNRDALLVFIAVYGTLTSIIVTSYQRGMGVLFVYPLFVSIVSCVGCHLVLHLQRLARRGSAANEAVVFTDLSANMTWNFRTRDFCTTEAES
ncbi:hypothetical protein PM082_001930 [Marasmius tenuissimus]|nr:hypothetical protein PM082_001930 [Marasmius tenuissimus]